MARPAKTTAVIGAEKKSHRTKAELATRANGENALKSKGKLTEFSEVASNAEAHKEYLRLKKIYTEIEKNEALYSAVINRYCLLYAECKDFEQKKARCYELIENIEQEFNEADIAEKDYISFVKSLTQLYRQALGFDSAIMAKRKMMFDTEKENVMTVSAAMRAIPKEAEKASVDPLLLALQED